MLLFIHLTLHDVLILRVEIATWVLPVTSALESASLLGGPVSSRDLVVQNDTHLAHHIAK